MGTTWDLAKAGSITLSNENLTAVSGNSNGNAVESTVGHSSGKYYYEIYINSTASVYFPQIGICSGISSEYALNATLGDKGTAYVYYPAGWFCKAGNTLQTGLATAGNGDIIGVAIDIDAGTLDFYVNNVHQGVQITGIKGVIETVYAGVAVNGTSIITARFAAASFTYPPPSGYRAWDYIASSSLPVCIRKPLLNLVRSIVVPACWLRRRQR